MMKILRVLGILVLAVILVGGGFLGYRLLRGGEQAESYSQVVVVERGTIVAAISPTGEVHAPRQAELIFDVNRIPLIELNVSPGHKVKAGDVLARIETSSLIRAVTQAEANLIIAQNDLEKAQTPYTELDLTKARLAVAQAEANLIIAQDDLEKAENPYTELDLAKAKLAVAQAEVALGDARDTLKELINPDIEAAQAAVRDGTTALENARRSLTVVQSDPDNAKRLRTLEYEANWYRNNYWEAQKKFQEGKIDQQKLDWEYSNMVAAEERLKVAQTNAESALASAENQVAKAEETLREAQESLVEFRQGPEALELTRAQNQVAQAEHNLAKARDDLAEIEAGHDPLELTQAQNQVAQAEYDLAKARDDLDQIEAGPDPDDVEVAQARLDSAQADLEEAQAALEDATMVAPFDGTVIDVGAEVGDLVSADVVVTLADLSHLEVKALVDETDISQIEIGQEAVMTFDALPGKRFKGRVLSVPLQGKLSQNIVTYEVPVSLEGAEDAPLKPGMTANLKITVGQRENVLLVPAMAVLFGEGLAAVLVQDNPDAPPAQTNVEVGLSDGVYLEIVRGLNEGDQVVIVFTPTEEGGGFPFGPGFGVQQMRRLTR